MGLEQTCESVWGIGWFIYKYRYKYICCCCFFSGYSFFFSPWICFWDKGHVQITDLYVYYLDLIRGGCGAKRCTRASAENDAFAFSMWRAMTWLYRGQKFLLANPRQFFWPKTGEEDKKVRQKKIIKIKIKILRIFESFLFNSMEFTGLIVVFIFLLWNRLWGWWIIHTHHPAAREENTQTPGGKLRGRCRKFPVVVSLFGLLLSFRSLSIIP